MAAAFFSPTLFFFLEYTTLGINIRTYWLYVFTVMSEMPLYFRPKWHSKYWLPPPGYKDNLVFTCIILFAVCAGILEMFTWCIPGMFYHPGCCRILWRVCRDLPWYHACLLDWLLGLICLADVFVLIVSCIIHTYYMYVELPFFLMPSMLLLL